MSRKASKSEGDCTRRGLLALGMAAGLRAAPLQRPAIQKRPIIDVTDLYHPHQDVGDNFDLISAYALRSVDLRCVILDVTQKFREVNEQDKDGPRDPGIIPVTQLNYLFDRNAPYGIGPFSAMHSPTDKMSDAPRFQQSGIELILETLRRSPNRVDILSFGSARPIAAAFNREPDLLRSKMGWLHLCAGATSPDYIEWNVALDPHAIVSLLRSDLRIAIYPCATKDGPFAYDSHNCFWKLPNLEFVRDMDPRLQSYIAYAFERSTRSDFLHVLDSPPPAAVLERFVHRAHNVWEMAVWAQVAGLKLVQRRNGYRLIPAGEVAAGDRVLPNELRPCRVEVRDNGGFTFQETGQPTNFRMYFRGDPAENERAFREALPALYLSYRP